MLLNRLVRATGILALGFALVANAAVQEKPAATPRGAIQAADEQFDQLFREEESARKKDPKWKASHAEIGSFKVGEGSSVTNFCLNVDGNLLVCNGGDRNEYTYDAKTGKAALKLVKAPTEIRVFSPGGTRLKTWLPKANAQAICVHPTGAIYVSGLGRVSQLDQLGRVVRSAAIPKLAGADVSGIAVNDKDLFVVAQSPTDFSFIVSRFDRDLKSPKQIVKGLGGCCGQLEIQTRDGELWVAHNARHRVERYDRNGKPLSGFGKNDRKAADGFGGCCEPKNIRFAPDGTILTAESGPPTVIKRFDARGRFLGVVALPNIQTGCVRVTVEVTKDGNRFYVVNSDDGTMHVIGKKG